MATTYEWKIVSLKGSPSDNEWLQTIRVIDYLVHATTDDGYIAHFRGSLRFESEAGLESIPFDETSETSMIEWLQSTLDLSQLYSRLDSDINRQRGDVPLVSMTFTPE